MLKDRFDIECSNCNGLTIMVEKDVMSTLVAYVPIYDENGVNTNPDRNTISSTLKCLECNAEFRKFGNDYDGYTIKKIT